MFFPASDSGTQIHCGRLTLSKVPQLQSINKSTSGSGNIWQRKTKNRLQELRWTMNKTLDMSEKKT